MDKFFSSRLDEDPIRRIHLLIISRASTKPFLLIRQENIFAATDLK